MDKDTIRAIEEQIAGGLKVLRTQESITDETYIHLFELMRFALAEYRSELKRKDDAISALQRTIGAMANEQA